MSPDLVPHRNFKKWCIWEFCVLLSDFLGHQRVVEGRDRQGVRMWIQITVGEQGFQPSSGCVHSAVATKRYQLVSLRF